MRSGTANLSGWLFSSLCLMIAWCPSASAQQAQWETYNKTGQAAYQKGDYQEAEHLFLQSLQDANKAGVKTSRIAAILTNLGAACREEGKYTAAEYIFKRALNISAGMDPGSKAVLLRHYGALLHETKNGGDPKTVLKDVPYIEKQLATDDKLSGISPHPQVIIDGNRSGFIDQGKFISAAELFTAVQLYRSAGLFLPAEELESRAREIFGASYPQIWATLAAQAQDEALKTVSMQNDEQEAKLRVTRALALEQEAKARAQQARADEAQARLQAQQDNSQCRDITPASGTSLYQINTSGDAVVPAPMTIVPVPIYTPFTPGYVVPYTSQPGLSSGVGQTYGAGQSQSSYGQSHSYTRGTVGRFAVP